MARILVIDDEPGICRALERYFKGLGNEVRTSSRAETGLPLSEAYEPDVVILDVRLPGMDGLAALAKLRERDPALPVIVVTAYGTMETAVEAVRRGAWDFVMKPLELEEIEEVVSRAVASRRQAQEVVIGKARPPERLRGESAPELVPMVGRTRAMQEVFKRVGAVSLSDVPVLLTGESGTGKEMAARAVHSASGRAAASFEPVNCASIAESAIDAEIFGAGGRLVKADGGSVFLDEAAELPAAVQARLVRYLDEGSFSPTDGGAAVSPDARVLAATQTDLGAAVAAGRFREDLYYRLKVATIRLPPLRERVADIPALVAHFLRGEEGPRGAISRDALRILVTHSWPGNVRELRSAVEHALVLALGKAILPDHLPEHVVRGSARRPEEDEARLREWIERVLDEDGIAGSAWQEVIDRVEAPLLAVVMARTDGNQVRSAKLLGIHRTTLRTKLQKHALSDAPYGT